MRIKKNKIQEIGVFLAKTFRKIAENFFAAALAFLLVAFLLGAALFYKYDILAGQKKIEVSSDTLKFKEDIYQKILVVWSEREKKFNQSDGKTFLNPFKAFTEELTK